MRSVGSVLWCSRNRPLWRPTDRGNIEMDRCRLAFRSLSAASQPTTTFMSPSSIHHLYAELAVAAVRVHESDPGTHSDRDPHSDRDLCTRVMDSLTRRPAPARRARCGHGRHARRRRGPGDGRRAAGAQGPGGREGRLLVRAGQRTARAVSTTRARRRLPTGAITPRCAEP